MILSAVADGTPLADCVVAASPTGLTEVFSLAVAGVASSADIAGVATPAVIVEVLPSTDSVGIVDSVGTLYGKCEN